jgi:hypothetical protein
VLRSLFNAVNRREYVRAYWYWEPGAAQLAPYPRFEQGYQDTASVQLTTGTVSGDVGAGQIYYRVPVTLLARSAAGQTRRYLGCYTLHLARPELQAVPPFHPLAIASASVRQVDEGADAGGLMAGACEA